MTQVLIQTSRVHEAPWGKNYGQAKHFWNYPAEAPDFRIYLGLATIEAPESIFTIFPNKTRLQFLIQGEIELSVNGRKQRLDSSNRYHRFSGEAHTTCSVLRGPVTVFNLICERQIKISEPVFGNLTELTLPANEDSGISIDLIFNLDGIADIEGGLETAQQLTSGDALILERKQSNANSVKIKGDAQLLYLSLRNI